MKSNKKAKTMKSNAYGRNSEYEVVLQTLAEKGLLSEPILSQPSAPEDLNSRYLFPHEPSPEPTIYSAADYQTDYLS